MILENMIRAYLSDTLRHVQVAGTIAARRVVMPGDQPAVYAAGWSDAVQAMAQALDLSGGQPLLEVALRSLPEPPMLDTLTPRERQIAEMVVAGMTSQQIGTQLVVEHSTVRAHRRSISRKTAGSSARHLRMWMQRAKAEVPG